MSDGFSHDRDVGHFVCGDIRCGDFFEVVAFEVFLMRCERGMWANEANGHEEGLLSIVWELTNLFDSPVGCYLVIHFSVGHVLTFERAGGEGVSIFVFFAVVSADLWAIFREWIEHGAFVAITAFFELFGDFVFGASEIPHEIGTIFIVTDAGVKDFAAGECVVSLFLKMFWKHTMVPHDLVVAFFHGGRGLIPTSGSRVETAEDRVTRGCADSLGAVSICEKEALLKETIHVRRLRFWVTTEAPFPVIEIINRDEEDVRPFLFYLRIFRISVAEGYEEDK